MNEIVEWILHPYFLEDPNDCLRYSLFIIPLFYSYPQPTLIQSVALEKLRSTIKDGSDCSKDVFIPDWLKIDHLIQFWLMRFWKLGTILKKNR